MTVIRIPPEEAHRLMSEGYVYLDVRSQPEFENGHPKGAYNVPLHHMAETGLVPNPHFLEVVKQTFPPDARLVIGCKQGDRSLRAAEQLAEAGFANIVEQRAGFMGSKDPFGQLLEGGWKHKDLPVALSPLPGHSYEDLAMKCGKQSPPRFTKSGRIIGADGVELKKPK